MATVTIQSSKLAIVFDAGMDEKGKARTRTKQIGSVKSEATADALLSTAEAFGNLSKQTIVQTERRDVSLIEA